MPPNARFIDDTQPHESTSTGKETDMTTGLLAPSHLILLALVALLVFGPKRLPEIGRSFGHGLRGFKESVSGDAPEADSGAAPVTAETRAVPQPGWAQLEQPAQPPASVQREEQQVA
jgi:sec-independent protein translocase protein TatA